MYPAHEMKTRWLPSIANLLVVVYAADAGLSVFEELFRELTGSQLLMLPRSFVATTVGTLALLFVPLLWLTPRLPIAAFACLVASALWLSTGAAPMLLVFEPGFALGLSLSLLQLAIAASMMLWCRKRNGGQGWLLRPDALEGPILSLRHSAVFALVSLFGLVPAALFYALLSLFTFVELGTQAFVSFDAVGVSLADRRYQRGDQQVRLVGMMHIGEEAAYGEIVRSFAYESTIVLEEGISDENSLLESPLSYERVAESLGLVGQHDLRSYLVDSDRELPKWPVLRNVDVDLSDFDPLTIEWLEWASSLWTSPEPLGALRKILARGTENEQQLAILEHDILTLRNERLLAEIERALEEYRNVVVPWGALHLPFIEAAILERGFEESQRRRHRLLSWMTVLAAL